MVSSEGFDGRLGHRSMAPKFIVAIIAIIPFVESLFWPLTVLVISVQSLSMKKPVSMLEAES